MGPKDKEVDRSQNKVKTDPLATVKQWKDLLVKTLVRQDNFGDTDKWVREQVKDSVLLQATVVLTGRVSVNETPPRYL